MKVKKGRPQKDNRSMDVIAQWLRERMEQDLRFSQQELGELVGVERQTVNRWMNGENSPPYEVLVAVHRMAAKAREGIRDREALRAEAQKVTPQDVEALTEEMDAAFRQPKIIGSIGRSPSAPTRSLPFEDRAIRQVADLIASRVNEKLEEWNAPSTGRGVRKLGVIAAGKPRLEEEQAETIQIDELLVQNPDTTYFLQVSGDSMSEAGIMDGDLVIVDAAREVKNRDIVVAEVDGEWTVKELIQRDGSLTLLPANARYQPIHPKQELRIAGVVTGVVRKLKNG